MVINIIDNIGCTTDAQTIKHDMLERLVVQAKQINLKQTEGIKNYPLLEKIIEIIRHKNPYVTITTEPNKKTDNFVKGLLFKASKLGVNIIYK